MLLAAGRQVVAEQGPFTLKLNEEAEGPELRRIEVLAHLARRSKHAVVGDTLRIRSKKRNEVVFSCHAAEDALHVIDTNGNDKVDLVWSAVKAQFSNISFLGAYVCKDIAGTSTPSQHSYGNAVDIGAASMAVLYDIADWLVARANEFDLEHVIVGDRIWTRGVGWHHYTGEYHYHVHADPFPQYSGGCRQT